MREFFGIGGHQRVPEGYLSWQHLLFVTLIVTAAILLGLILGRCLRSSPERRDRALKVTALLLDAVEIAKIVFLCFREHDPMNWLYNLPLFLCSMQMIALPLVAFSKGRLRMAALDFVAVFGVLGMVMGTYGAGQNYNAYPVLSFNNVVSGLTHCIAGFASVFILRSGMASLEKKNMGLTAAILTGLCAVAYAANLLIPYNYMFLMRGDGTPYDLLFNLVSGSPVLYPLGVVALFLLYIAVFYGVVALFRKKRGAK